MPPKTISIDGDLTGQVSLQPEENPEDRAARIARENAVAKLNNFKEYTIFVAVLVGSLAVLGICGYLIAFDASVNPEHRRWAENVFSALATGAVSYVVGRKVGK